MKSNSRFYRRLARGWRYFIRKSFFTKMMMIGLLCIMSLFFFSLKLSGTTDRTSDTMNHGLKLGILQSLSMSQTSAQVFHINEVKGEPLSYYDMPTLARRFREREKLVAESCRGREESLLGLSSEKWAYERIEINTKTRTVYCPLLKVGSTFWRRVFYAIRQNKTINTPYDVSIHKALASKRQTLKELLPLNKSSTQDYIKNSVNIMYVREPFSRLLSGYIDKLFAPNPYFWSVVGKFIIKNYRKNPNTKSLNCGHDVTFQEFVKYVLDTEENNKPQRDAHFTPTYDQCKPCQIHYNSIGKMESFKEDTAYVFHTLGYNISVNSLKLWAEKAEEDAVIDSTYSPFNWKKSIQKCMSFHEAAKRIWHKMQIRGIVRKDIRMPFTEMQMRSVGPKYFVKALLGARGPKTDREYLNKQKREALQKVFQLVPSEDIAKIRNLFRPDFELFGYDLYPKHIFPESGVVAPEDDWLFDLPNV